MYLLFRLDERMRRRPHPGFWDHRQRLSGADPGGGGGTYTFQKVSVHVDLDFYSGFKKKHNEGVQFEILRNPGIDFYSGFRKKSR